MVEIKISEEGAKTTLNGIGFVLVNDCLRAVEAMYKALSSLNAVGPLAARIFKEVITDEHSSVWDDKLPDNAVVVDASGLRKGEKEENHGEE